MKKMFTFVMVLVIITVILTGCSGNGTADELIGKFSGEAGKLEFLPEGEVEVNFSDDYVWMVTAASNNNKILQYRFVTKKNETAHFKEAEYLNFADEGVLIISNPCTVQEDKIILYPSSVNETILTREVE